jgi:hypothetical protein
MNVDVKNRKITATVEADLGFFLEVDDAKRTGNLKPLFSCATVQKMIEATVKGGYSLAEAKATIEEVCRKAVAQTPFMTPEIRTVVETSLRQNN